MNAAPERGVARPVWAGAALLFVLSLVLRVAILHATQYDGLYGQDPYAYFDYVAALRAALLHGQGPPPFHWPLGYPMLCFLVSLFTGPTAMAGQAASVLCGAACAPLVFLLVLQCRRDAWLGAFLAGLVMGSAFYAVSLSMSYMSDLSGLMWALIAAVAMLRHSDSLRVRWLALAAFALAAALLTRWVYALMIVPLGLAALTAYFERHTPWRKIAAHAGVAVAVGGAVMLLHFAPSLLREDAKVAYAGNLRDYSWSPGNFFKKEFDSADGHISWPQTPAEYYLWPLRDRRYVTPVFTPLLVFGLIALLRRAPRAAAVLMIAWALVFYLFFAGVYMQNNRFPLSYFPPLLAAFALGFESLARVGSRQIFLLTAIAAWIAWQGGLGTTWLVVAILPLILAVARPRLAPYALAAAVIVCGAPDVRQTVLDANWFQTRVVPKDLAFARWAAPLVPADRVLLAQGNTMTLVHNLPQHVIDLFNLSDEDRDAILARDGELFVMIDPVACEKQWAGLRPMTHITWLRAHTEFSEVAARENYHLYRARIAR